MNIYAKIFLTFSKIGAFTLGGGYAMLPLIEHEVVDKNLWLSKEDFLDVVAVAQSLPGIFAVNISIFIGYKLRKLKGSIVCALATILPSFLIILLIAMFFSQYKDNPVITKLFKGIRPAIVALIAVPVFSSAKAAKITFKTAIIPILSVVLISFLNVSPVFVILIAGLAGVLYHYLKHKS